MSDYKKVCHLTSVHPLLDTRIFYKECVSLAKAGYDVSIIVTGETDKSIENIKVYGINKGKDSRLYRMFFTVKKVYKKAVEVDADIYHFHDPELLPAGKKLVKKGKKVIYDTHEDLPLQIMTKHWLPVIIRKPLSYLVEKIEKHYSKRLSAIIAATPIIKKRFQNYNSNTIDVCNYPIIEELENNISWDTKENSICYIGSIFKERGIVELMKAIENPNVTLELAGTYSPESLRDELTGFSTWNKVHEYGYVGRNEIRNILGKSKAGMVTLLPKQSYMESLPIKMFEYMAAGIPVIASDFPLWKEIIEKYKCGLCVNPEKPSEIEKAILTVLGNDHDSEKMGLNGINAVKEVFNWKVEEKKMLELYSKLL